MAGSIRIDRAARCGIRTGRTLVPSQHSAQGSTPVKIPAKALPGRRWLRVLNRGLASNPTRNGYVVIGGPDVRWPSPGAITVWGYGLGRLESVDLPIDDGVEVFCVADPAIPDGESVDLRTIELAGASGPFGGKRGRRARAVGRCRVQGSYGFVEGAEVGGNPLPYPPAKPLQHRLGILVKYFAPSYASGHIYIRGNQLVGGDGFYSLGSKTGFPVGGKTGDTSKAARRGNHVLLPVDARIPLYIIVSGTEEYSSALEFS